MKMGRAKALSQILDSQSPRKLIIAGPGTGKTHTFREVLSCSTGPRLAVTFLKSLVHDLEASVGDLASVFSFHGFARWLLHSRDVPGLTREVDYFPAIAEIFASDITLTIRETDRDEIEELLMNLNDDDPVVDQVLAIGSYYNAVGHTDSVFRVLRYLETNPEGIPEYGQVVVDEFQDFSLLEVELIEKLASASPILIAGDDDQALYGFRHASAAYIRELADDDRYTTFELPYCSRCTEVMVDATHRVVAKAQAAGLLEDRLPKAYRCYLPGKRTESAQYPTIRHARCTVQRRNAPYIDRYIASALRTIPAHDIAESREDGYPTVLIVGPKQFTGSIYELIGHEFADVELKTSSQLRLRALDGYLRLLKDIRSRLGWRVLLAFDEAPGCRQAVRDALETNAELVDLIDENYRDRHLAIVDVLSTIVDGRPLTEDEQAAVTQATEMDIDTLRRELGVESADDSNSTPPDNDEDDSEHEPRIVITSLVGAKGLEASHVIVVGLNDGHFPRQNSAPTDDEVCQLLVALTRGRKTCTLVSTDRFGSKQLDQSVFIDWLQPLLTTLVVNKDYLARLE